jgi:hypothetical protein
MNNAYQELRRTEEMALTAQAAAYRAFAQNERRLFSEQEGAESLPARSQVLNAIKALYAVSGLSGSDKEAFFEEIGDHLGSALRGFFEPGKGSLKFFLDDYQSETLKYGSIKDEVNSWLNRLRAAASQYLSPKLTLDPSFPLIDTRLEIDESITRGISGKTEPNISDSRVSDRTIVLSFNPSQFTQESYFAIPYVLSHEFWCHCLSRWYRPSGEAEQWRGCDPHDPWEEGWMDFMQTHLLRSKIVNETDAGATIESLFVKSCNQYSAARYEGGAHIERGLGYRAAERFLRFLITRERLLFDDCGDTSVEDIFVKLSLDMNGLDIAPKLKRQFATWTLDFLDLDQLSQNGAAQSDQLLIQKRKALTEIIARNIEQDPAKIKSLNVLKLLSLCGHLD